MFKRSRVNDKWTVEGKNRIVVTLNAGVGRYIFGIPWLAFGVYFLYRYLILGIAEYIKAGDIAGVFTGALGWLLIILFFGGIFIVPGWVLVFLRRKVVIDAARGEVDEKNDYLIFSRSKTHPLADFNNVLRVGTYSKGTTSRGGTTTYMYDVRLMPRVIRKERDYVLVGTMQDEAEAERLGRATSELVDLPYVVQEELERI